MIFPADAGVNLTLLHTILVSHYIPRGCGGEPGNVIDSWTSGDIFPADAGVNPVAKDTANRFGDIPRGCGGEPWHRTYTAQDVEYSPRMRG